MEFGEFVAIAGTSGSGKSPLLHMLGELDGPTNGSITIDGKDIFPCKTKIDQFLQRKIGFVF
nr:ATP-binding cassette domain-containing protein [Paenibacillus sp. Mc5Re-14]